MHALPCGRVDRWKAKRHIGAPAAPAERWTVGRAMLMALLASLALWSLFGAALYILLA